jgi:hypothetical protein
MTPKVTGLREAEPFMTLKMAIRRSTCMKATVYVRFVQVGHNELAVEGGFVKVANKSCSVFLHVHFF